MKQLRKHLALIGLGIFACSCANEPAKIPAQPAPAAPLAMRPGAPAASQDRRPPNIVLILADDLGYHDVSFDGRKEWQTPNLDRLGAQGTIFRRWYTAAVVCAPSRAALMTGRYSIHNGVTGNSSLDLPSEEVTIAEALKTRGYATGLFGKWHRGAPRPGFKTYTHPMDQGFDEFFGFTSAVHAWQKFPTKLYDGREMKPSQGYADTLFANRTIDFIQRHQDQPFFAYVPFIAPHGLIGAPQEDISQHRGKFKEKSATQPVNATYAAEVTRMDTEVGRILKALDDLRLSENTIVIFSSDHGATFEKMQQGATNYLDSNYPFRGQKRTLWEGGVHVPGIIRWPGHVPGGTQSQEIVHNIDIFPTLLTAAGVQADEKLKIDGVNLLDTIEGKAPSPPRTIFWEWDEGGNKQLAAMRGDFKLIISGGNEPELYDVVNDPAERRDIHAEYPGQSRELKKQLDEWIKTTSPAALQKHKPASNAATQGHSVEDE